MGVHLKVARAMRRRMFFNSRSSNVRRFNPFKTISPSLTRITSCMTKFLSIYKLTLTRAKALRPSFKASANASISSAVFSVEGFMRSDVSTRSFGSIALRTWLGFCLAARGNRFETKMFRSAKSAASSPHARALPKDSQYTAARFRAVQNDLRHRFQPFNQMRLHRFLRV